MGQCVFNKNPRYAEVESLVVDLICLFLTITVLLSKFTYLKFTHIIQINGFSYIHILMQLSPQSVLKHFQSMAMPP